MAGIPIVIVDSGGLAMSESATGFGIPVSIADNGFGTPVTVVQSGGLPAVGLGAGPPAWAPGALFAHDFAADQYYGVQPTMSRASGGYAENVAGELIWFGNDAFRRTNKGLLLEPARTNLITQSQAFENAAWTRTNIPLPTANTATAPDLTVTAETLVDDGVNGAHTAGGNSISFTNGLLYYFSVMAKTGTSNLIQITPGSAAFNFPPYANFDLTAGTIVGSGGTGVGQGIIPMGGGWYRLWLSALCTASASTSLFIIRIASGAAGRSPSYAGTGIGVSAWGAEVKQDDRVSSYIPTAGSAATRAADAGSINAPGVTRIVYTFDDASTQEVTGVSMPYNIPTSLNRPYVARMAGFAS